MLLGFPGGSDSKESACNAGDPGERSPGEGNGNPLQYSCLANPMDGGDWRATIRRATESDTTEQLHSLKRFYGLNLRIKMLCMQCFFPPNSSVISVN